MKTKTNSSSIWILFVFLILYACSLLLFPRFFNFLDHNYNSDHSPPWFFIINDFKIGLGAIIGASLCLLILLVYYKKAKPNSEIALVFVLIWFGLKIGSAIVILLNTKNIINPMLSTTNWNTHNDYLANAWNRYGYIIYIAVITIGYLTIVIKRRSLTPK